MRLLAVWLVAAGMAGASLMNVCALLFQCGCRAWWAGAASRCNIHQAGAHHCPWCTLDPQIFWSLFAFFVAGQGGVVWLTQRRAWWWQLGGALGVYLGLAALSAAVLGFFQHYWN